MRQTTWLALGACLLMAGCSNPRDEQKASLSDSMDKALRLYEHALKLQANPLYVAVASEPAATQASAMELAPVPRKLERQEMLVPGARPADPRPEQMLKEAAGLLETALSAAPLAPPAIRGDGYILLGRIQMAIGNLHGQQAEQAHEAGAFARMRAQDQVMAAKNYAGLLGFAQALAGMSRDQIVARQKQAQAQLGGLTQRTDALKAEVAQLEQANTDLVKLNLDLLKQARAFRDQSEQQTGPEGVKLLAQAQSKERDANANLAKTDTNKDKISRLQADRAQVERALAGTKLQLDVVTRHLEAMGERTKATNVVVEAAKQDLQRVFGKLQEQADQLNKQLAIAATHEKPALDAYEAAAKSLNQAEAQIQQERQEASNIKKPEEVALDLAGPGHLMTNLSERAAANLALGQLRGRQLLSGAANDALAKEAEEAAQAAARAVPPAIEQIKQYPGDRPAIHKAALDNYAAAEADLKTIIDNHIREGTPHGNAKWMYQGLLADALLGHYRLSGEAGVRTEAATLVKEALADKEHSPYLASVLRLRRLIEGDTATVPTRAPAAPAAVVAPEAP